MQGLGEAYALIETGTLKTPAGDLPAQIVSYEGDYFLYVGPDIGTQALEGTFTAVADFSNGTISFTTDNGLASTATISGNRFAGSFAGENDDMSVDADLAGGFYGPTGEEIAAVVGGTHTNKTTTDQSVLAGALLGKTVAPP